VKTARQLIARLLVDAKKHDLIRHDLTNTDLSLAMFFLARRPRSDASRRSGRVATPPRPLNRRYAARRF